MKADVENEPGITCVSCGNHHSKVRDSRPIDDGIRRRRECDRCGHRFTTYESRRADVVEGERTEILTVRLPSRLVDALAEVGPPRPVLHAIMEALAAAAEDTVKGPIDEC